MLARTGHQGVDPVLECVGGDVLAKSVKALAALEAGRVRPIIDRIFPMAEAAQAHEDLAERTIHGKVRLIPRAQRSRSRRAASARICCIARVSWSE